VRSVSEREWTTTITIGGSYDGPTDVIAVKDYRLDWSTDGKTLSEKGSSTLQLASGKSVRSEWTSIITPTKPNFERFASSGETATVTFTPFQIDGNKMTYEWSGTVDATKR
jgi:hypothetical protein